MARRKIQRVCLIGALAVDYPRNAIITAGLAAQGVQVDVRAAPKALPAMQRVRFLLENFPQAGEYDAVILATFNQLVAPVAWLLARQRRVCLLVDYMVGQMDMLEDRVVPLPATKRLLYQQIDRFNLRFAALITDTASHRDYFQQLNGVAPRNMHILPVGVQDMAQLPPPNYDAPLVQYAGTFIPFHGVDVILRAAQRLPHVPFELIGVGQHLPQAKQLSQDLALQNVTFVEGYFPRDELRRMQARSTLMLGVFSDVQKTRYVIPNKVYEALALGRPLITAQAPALEEFLTVGEHLLTVRPADDAHLAERIQHLLDDRAAQAHLRAAGRAHIEAALLPQHLGTQLLNILEQVCP